MEKCEVEYESIGERKENKQWKEGRREGKIQRKEEEEKIRDVKPRKN